MKRSGIIYSILLCALVSLASCTKQAAEESGYIQMRLTTLTSTLESKASAAPEGYDPRKLYVEFVDKDNNIVLSTHDYSNDPVFAQAIELKHGEYTINVHSDKWDGSGSGKDTPYYEGHANVTVEAKKLKTVNIVCTLANVKFTVNYDNSFRTSFAKADVQVSSMLKGVASQSFVMGDYAKDCYFPAGDIALVLNVQNYGGDSFIKKDTIRNVQPREYIKIVYTVAEAGNLSGIKVNVDDESRTYEFDVPVPRKPGISFDCRKVNAWSHFAYLQADLTGKTADFDPEKFIFQWKKADASDWTDIPNSQLTYDGNDGYSFKLTGLSDNTKYAFRAYYGADTPVEGDVQEFTTEEAVPVKNAGFEDWVKDGASWYPNLDTKNVYWNSSNPGSTSMGDKYNVTTKCTDFVHSGSASAKLACQYIVIKFAAASIFTGNFQGLIGTSGAKLDWGVPFTSRPTALKGYWSYAPGKINRGSKPSGAADKNENDNCQIFCVLLREQLHVGGNAEEGIYKKSTVIDWENDERIIAYGELSKNTGSNGQWEEFTVPLKYHTTTEKPAYMAIVCAASKWGDYFYGSDSTVLYLDDLSFEYGNTPSVK